MINQDWKIKSRAHVCSVTNRPFADEEPFFTALFEDDSDEGFVRRDYSVEAWQAEKGNVKPFSHWRSVYEAPKAEPAKAEVVEKESAEGLLRRLVEEDDPLTENARFILAVMLERKKTLRETDSKSLGQARLRLYEHAKTGEVFIIRDPMLRLDQIDAVQREVADLLSSRSAPPPPAEAPAAESPASEAPAVEAASAGAPVDADSAPTPEPADPKGEQASCLPAEPEPAHDAPHQAAPAEDAPPALPDATLDLPAGFSAEPTSPAHS